MSSRFRRHLPCVPRFVLGLTWLLGVIGAHVTPADAASTRTRVAPWGAPPVELHAEEAGRGAPVLLLHGLGASGYSWRHVIAALARNSHVIALDLRGFGRSEKPFDQRYSPADQAAHVIDFIRRRGLRDVTLVGHSFGGAVALLVTLRLDRTAPRTIRRLALLDVPAYPQQPTAFVSLLRQPVLPYALLTLVPPELPTSAALANERKAGKVTRDDISRYAAPYYEAGARHALIATARQIRPVDWRRIIAAYPSIRQPTLIVWCDHDDVVPVSSGIRLAKALPNSKLRVVKGCEHSPQDEEPQQLLGVLRPFLK